MKILAVDTALAACSAAVYDAAMHRVLGAAFRPMATGHAEEIGPMVRDVMKRAEVEFSALHRIAATIGPGTFTGLRIGLAFARGLGLALGLPVVGISTLKAIAANVDPNPQAVPIAVVIDARRGNVYSQLFSASLDPLNDPLAHSLSDAATRLPTGKSWVIGSAAEDLLATDLGSHRRVSRADASPLPHAALVAELAAREPAPAAPPSPLYLRLPNAKPHAPRLDSIEIRKAQPADAEALAKLHAVCFDQPWDAKSLRELMDVPESLSFLASHAGETVGFLLARSAADEAEILTLAVAPRFRRRRLASRLIATAAAALQAAGAHRLYIEVASSNVSARRLYDKADFAVSGVRRGYYSGPGGAREDAVLMSRSLPIANRDV